MKDIDDEGGPAFPSGDGVHASAPSHYYGLSVRDWFAGQAMAALLADHDTEWNPEAADVVEDPDGPWMLNQDAKIVYPRPVGYTPDRSHVRVRTINTWRERLVREAYRIADAMPAARKQVRG